ncbi:MAG TPA: hypothetical protein VMD08_17750 [Candidatus Baltobacteraceae bacterium]|nr:hypothetical protein [Candidatus Baltobacteraceae bacterium]
MASYPSAKVHKPSRRRLGRGQAVQKPVCTMTASAVTTTVTLTFSQPVVANGTIDLHVSTGIALVSQVQSTPTTVTQVYAASVVGKTWSVDGTAPVRTFQGGSVAPAAGTF